MNCRRAKPICPHASSLAGVWGKPSPQVPPEARPNGGPAARVQGASQPRAEGARKDSGDFSQALLLETPQLTFAEPSDMRGTATVNRATGGDGGDGPHVAG